MDEPEINNHQRTGKMNRETCFVGRSLATWMDHLHPEPLIGEGPLALCSQYLQYQVAWAAFTSSELSAETHASANSSVERL